MPNPRTAFGKFDMNVPLLLAVLILVPLIGNWWMNANGIQLGATYFFMLVGSITIFVFAMLFFKGDNMQRLSKYIKAPFSTSLVLATGIYLIAWLVPLLVEFIFWIFRKTLGVQLSVTSFSIPLFAEGRFVSQSFSAVAFQTRMDWKIFNLVFNASAIEEITYSFALVILGIMVGILFLRYIMNKKISEIQGSDINYVLIFAILFASLLFAGSHQLNATYVGIMFLIAFIFKVVSLVAIYFWGIFLIGVIGYHASNNFIYLVQKDGATAVINGMFSWIGLGIVVFFALMILYLIRNWDTFMSELKKYFNF